MNITDRDFRFLEEMSTLSDETKIRLILIAGKDKLPFLSLSEEYNLKKSVNKSYWNNICYGYVQEGDVVETLPRNILKVKKRKKQEESCSSSDEEEAMVIID